MLFAVHRWFFGGAVLTCLVLAPLSSADASASNDTDNAPSFLPKKTGLRVPKTLADRQRFLDITAAHQMQTPFDELSKQEQVELFKSFKSSMITVLDEVKETDLSDLPQDLKNYTEIATLYAENAIKVLENALPFLESQILGTGIPSLASAAEVIARDDWGGSSGGRQQQRRLESNFAGSNADGSGPDDNLGGSHKSQWRKSPGGQQKPGAHHYEYMGHSFHPHSSTNHARKMGELHEAISNGDIHSIFASFGAGNSQRSSDSRLHRKRRMTENTRRRLSLNEQCELLADCASHMSLYDTFVYYYSDDIDPATGKVDDNLVKFDERDISMKYQQIQAGAKVILENGAHLNPCNDLLSLFHRTIEHGSVPEWEGASVNQVCLAEGTTVFVQFQEMAFALVDQSFLDGYGPVSEKKWVDDVDEAMKTVAEQIAVEPFQCAEDMFYKTKRYDSFRRGVRCDRAYEIKTSDECLDWGRKAGATLLGANPVVDQNNYTPCGCFIDNKTRVLYFNAGSTNCQNRFWQYSLVCKQTVCGAGYEITSVEECRKAGLSIPGTFLFQDNVHIQEDANSPAGCVIHQPNGAVHFDTGKGKTGSESHFLSSPVCKEHDPRGFPFGGCGGKSDSCGIDKYKFPSDIDVATEATKEKAAFKTYETLRKRVDCDKGYEIKSPEECQAAGLKVGGLLINEKINLQNRHDIPCGCSIYPGDRWVHWNTRSDNCQNHGWRHTVVCSEHRNRDDFELVEFTIHCSEGQDIGSVEDCAEAGQALGGWLPDFKVKVTDWSIPCGCSMHQNGGIHFNVPIKQSCSLHGDFRKVCKNGGRPFVTSRLRSSCDPGYEISDAGACREAGNTLVGNQREMKTGHWDHTPCNCYIWKDSQQIHFDTDCSRVSNDGQSLTVCKNRRIGEKYKRVQFTKKCSPGEEVSQEECAVAGQALFGYLQHSRVDVGRWGHAPCGCFINVDGKIHFNTETRNCGNDGYGFDAVCHQQSSTRRLASDMGMSDTEARKLLSIAQELPKEELLAKPRHANVDSTTADAIRDVHGKLISNGMSGFFSADYGYLMRKGESCVTAALLDMKEECLDSAGNKQNSKYYECRVKKRKTAIEECNRFGPIQRALKLIFGQGTSPGFICGVRDAVVNDNVAMPGSCCLDAPYERDGDEWGQPYDCDSARSCKHPGPFLSGINKDACDAHGGTWCPSKSSCDELQRCTNKLADEAKSEKRLAFEQYVRGAPMLNNTNNREQCGRVRAYFGFDENFINDKQICEDVEQLKFAKDFDFLDDFFKQGSDKDAGPGEESELQLTPPDRSTTNLAAVKNHWTWKKTNFALEMAGAALHEVVEFIVSIECPCDITCITEWACKGVKDTLYSLFTVIEWFLVRIWMISVEMWEIESATPSAVSAQENSEVIFENMQKMADYLVKIHSKTTGQRDLLASLPGGQAATNLETTPRNFRVKLEVLEKAAERKSIYAHTTLDGILADAKFVFSRVDTDDDTIVLVPFNRTNVASGQSIIRFGSDVENTTFLVVEASPIEGEEVFNEVVSFG